MSSATAPTRQLTVEEKKIEKSLTQELKHDEQFLKHATKDLKSAEKSQAKGVKAVEQAVKSHSKAVKTENKTAKALNKAAHVHDNAAADEQKTAKEIQIKEQNRAKVEQDLRNKNIALEQAQQKKEANDRVREAKLADLGKQEPAST